MIEVLFWILFSIVLYVYIGYPVIVYVISLIVNRQVGKKPFFPHVTIVVPAYNEEKYIKNTIENKLLLEYPDSKLEVIVVSDGSTDNTDAIVGEFFKENVRLIRQEPRMGKTLALNKAVEEASGEIIVFSDANSLYSKDALINLVANFSDKSVGYVTGKMIYSNRGGNPVQEGCSSYMMYEYFLRNAETRIGSVVGVDGGIDAVRKYLYEPMKQDQLPDFILPLRVVEKGYRVVFDEDAISCEESLNDSGDEYKMRVRVALRALNAINDMKHILDPKKMGLFAWQYFSHKILRYYAFILLLLMYCINIVLLKISDIYLYLLVFQSLFYLGALMGWILERRQNKGGLLYVPFYFCLLNIASAQAFIMMISGDKRVVWEPRKG